MILVGAAILVGFQIYDQSNRESAIDTMTKDLVSLAGDAMNYYRRPVATGGGGQSFVATSKGGLGRWAVPPNLDTLDNRFYQVSTISDNSLEIMGRSIDEETGLNGSEGVAVFVSLNQNGVTGFRIEN
jgi:hypothetical protein